VWKWTGEGAGEGCKEADERGLGTRRRWCSTDRAWSSCEAEEASGAPRASSLQGWCLYEWVYVRVYVRVCVYVPCVCMYMCSNAQQESAGHGLVCACVRVHVLGYLAHKPVSQMP